MEWLGLGEKEMSVQAGIISPGQVAKPGLKINIYSRGITQTGTKTFSPGWYYQPGLKVQSRLVIPAGTKAFSPGLGDAPGIKINLQSRFGPLTGTNYPIDQLISSSPSPSHSIQTHCLRSSACCYSCSLPLHWCCSSILEVTNLILLCFISSLSHFAMQMHV